MPNPRRDENPAIPDPQSVYFNYTQQVSQAFVQFIPEEIARLDPGDVFIAYCHTDRQGKPSIIGAFRYHPYFSEEYNRADSITVPVMGNDTPYNPNIYPVPANEDGRIYCRHGDQIYISHIKRNGTTTNLNQSFDITNFYNTAVEIATPRSPDNIDDGVTEICDCRTFNCRDCNQNVFDINDQFLSRCCAQCCQNDDDDFQCDYPCPDGNSTLCPQGWSCIGSGENRCCQPDDSGGDIG